MKIITFKDIASLNISPLKCFEWVEEMIKNKKQGILPAKISLKPFEGAFCNVMPGIICSQDSRPKWGGIKAVTRYPDRTPSLESRLLLMNVESGEFIAFMDGSWITAMRTGAVAAHSVMLFAKEGFKTIGIMGLGNTSRAALITLAEKMPEKEFTVKLLRYKGQEASFIERLSGYKNISFTCVDTAEELIRGSDVVISGVTYLSDDICPDNCYDEGTLIVPIHTRGFTNCDLFFDKVYADDLGHVKHFKNFGKFKSFAEVCDVVNKNAVGRENATERIIVYNIGISLHDINFAANIYNIMSDAGMIDRLPEINMQDPTDKFWV